MLGRMICSVRFGGAPVERVNRRRPVPPRRRAHRVAVLTHGAVLEPGEDGDQPQQEQRDEQEQREQHPADDGERGGSQK